MATLDLFKAACKNSPLEGGQGGVMRLQANALQKKQKLSSRRGGTKAQRRAEENLCGFFASLRLCVRFSFIRAFAFSLLLATQTTFAQNSPATDDFLYAQKLFNEGYHELCLAQLEAFRQRYPDAQELAEGWKLIGEANMALRRFAEAETAFRTFEIRYPFHQTIEEMRLRLADSQKAQGHLEHAALTLQRFVALHPRSEKAALAQHNACALLQELGEHQKAREGLYALLENYPESTQRLPAYFLLVKSFSEAGDYARALQEAERMLRSLPENQLEAQTFFMHGRLQEQVGHLQLAEQSYQELLKKFPKGKWAGQALARLAELQFARGDIAAAIASLDLSAHEASALKQSRLALRKAEMHLQAGQSADAFVALQKFDAVASDSVAKIVYYYTLGNLHEKNGRKAEAVEAYQRGVQLSLATEAASDSTSTAPLHRRQRSLWRGAQTHVDLQQYDTALQWCRQYRREYPNGKFRDAVLYLEGRAHQAANNLTIAQRLYDELLIDYPKSAYVDDAQFALAETYETAGEMRMAQLQWQRFLQSYPASENAEAARRKLRVLTAASATDSPAALTQLSETLLQAKESASREEFLVSLARLNYERQNYRAAQKYAQLAAENASAAATAREAAYLLGASYLQLHEIERTRPSLQDSARLALQSLSAGERDQFAQKAETLLARTWFLKDTPRTTETLSRADSLLALNEESLDFDFLHLWAASTRKSLSTASDSAASNRIVMALQRVAQNENSIARNEALFELADWYWQRGDSSNAARCLEQMRASKWRDVFDAKGQLLKAKWLAQHKQYDGALATLQRLEQECFYSAFADSAAAMMTRIYITTGRFKEALQSLNNEATETHAHESDNVDLTRGRLLEATGEHAQAVQAYLRFIANHPNAPEIAAVLLEVARLTLRAGAERLAIGYYEECARRFPGTEHSVEAKFRLADIHYDKGAFEAAQPLYLEAMNEQPNAALAKEALKKWILCLYKTKNFSRAEVEAKKFEEQNKSERASVAEFQYAAGEAALEAKDFVSADRIFRKLGKDYRDTPSGILGDYGLGKALLIQNKTEEALETLTGIPKRYPKHPFLHTAYLGLGDFYSAQQQWDNAIAAFNQVTKDSTFDSNYRLAIRSLLDVYDRMNLKDRALALARHYVARFPEDVKALDLRIKAGLLLIDLLQFDDAIAHLKRLKPFVDASVEPEVQYYIGKSHMNAGRFELAIAELLRVKFFSKPSKLPWDVIALYDAATCYTRINNCSMAKKLFQQIVREQGAASDFGRFANVKVAELGACEAAN